MLMNGLLELRRVDPQPAGQRDEVLLAQRFLVIEDVGAELPEVTVARGGHRGLVGDGGLRMKRQWKISELQPDAIRIAQHEVVDDANGGLRYRALEIRKELQHHRRVRRPAAHHGVGHLRQRAQAQPIANDQFLELRKRSGAGKHLAVDGVRRRPVDAELGAFGDVAVDRLLGLLAVHVFLKASDVETHLLRIGDEVVLLHALLVGEEQVVHLPELALRLRRHRRPMCDLRVRMDDQREVLELHRRLHAIDALRLQLAERLRELRAVGTLEVGIQNDLHRRQRRTVVWRRRSGRGNLGSEGEREQHGCHWWLSRVRM